MKVSQKANLEFDLFLGIARSCQKSGELIQESKVGRTSSGFSSGLRPVFFLEKEKMSINNTFSQGQDLRSEYGNDLDFRSL